MKKPGEKSQRLRSPQNTPWNYNSYIANKHKTVTLKKIILKRSSLSEQFKQKK